MLRLLISLWRDERGIFGIDDAIIGLGGAAIGGIAGLVGQNSANAANKEMMEMSQIHQNAQRIHAQEFNSAEAAKARAWSEGMANTAYQRQVKDMEAAGINPMLAIMKGGGAATPGAAQASSASSSAPSAPRMESALNKGVQSALDALRLRNEFATVKADTELKGIQKTVQESVSEREKNSAKIEKTRQEIIDAQAPAAKARAEADKRSAEIDAKMAGVDAVLKRVGAVTGIANGAAGAARIFRGGSGKSFKKQYDKMIEDAGSDGVPLP